jgi:hypothetical protein
VLSEAKLGNLRFNACLEFAMKNKVKLLAAISVLSLGVMAAPAGAAVLLTATDGNIPAGVAAFGPATAAITWSHMFAPGTVWSVGALAPSIGGATQTDPATGASVTGNLNTANWIDEAGFNSGPGGVGPELAINGAENFTLNFAAPVTRVGFTVATGRGTLASEIDHLGAIFNLIASNGDTGTLTLLDNGGGSSVWVSIVSATPFSSLTFSEPSGNIFDQYFGDVFVGAAIPEPSTWAMMIVGFGLLGAGLRRQRRLLG